MKLLSIATCVMLFTLTGYATALDYHWPPTDPDPYFKKRDAEIEAEQRARQFEPKQFDREYPQEDSE
jgi:hypothetical protein